MAELTPEIAGDVIATCRTAAEEIGSALTRGIDSEFVGITIQEQASYDAAAPPDGFDGPGLIVALTFGETGFAAVLPESTGMLPGWYGEPDATGKSKLNTLAQELGMLLVPDTLVADAFDAFRVPNLSAALTHAELSAEAVLLPILLKSDPMQGQLSLVWPIAKPGDLRFDAEIAAEAAAPSEDVAETEVEPAAVTKVPDHTRSMFRVRVPVSVNLATQKQSVQDILDLVPGSIIKFEKACDELLDLMVGDQPVASGEVVKVGDKFGLRIRNMVQPKERFIAIRTTMPT